MLEHQQAEEQPQAVGGPEEREAGGTEKYLKK
jgi:hypothetical protein